MNKLKHIYKFVTDRKNITLVFFLIIALAITYSTIEQIEYNYQLETQAQEIAEEIALLEQQNANQQLLNEFYQTDYYQELNAKDQLGLVSPGEKVLVFSQNQLDVNQEKVASLIQQFETNPIESDQPSPIEQWFNFFSGRPPQN